MTWSTLEIESLLHIHEKAQGHGPTLVNIRDEAMAKLQEIELEAKKSREERIAKAKAEHERKLKEVAAKREAELEKEKGEPLADKRVEPKVFKPEVKPDELDPDSSPLYPPESGVNETTLIDRRV